MPFPDKMASVLIFFSCNTLLTYLDGLLPYFSVSNVI